ncbi:hypothetical protein VPH35_032933 [Triticum aestivum]
MSFFHAASRPRSSQQDLVRSIKDSLLALDTMTGAKLGSTAIGLKSKDGVVLAVEKCVTSLLLISNVLVNMPVNDNHGVPEDIADVIKDINDGMYSLNVDDGDGSLQLSDTQSQSVDGTEPVTQDKDVPMQLQLKDERIRKKKYDFKRRKELERRQEVARVQQSDVDVAQAPKVFKEKKAILKRKMSDRNPDGTQRRSPRVKAGSQPGNSKADGDSVAVKIGPSKLGDSPVHRSPRGLTNKKPSSSPLQERSLLKENKKRKVHPAKVNKGVKKHARVEAEDAVSEEDDVEVDSEDEFAAIEQDEAAASESRASDGTEANISDHERIMLAWSVLMLKLIRMRLLALTAGLMMETIHNVEAAVDHGVNDPSTDKCKVPLVGDGPCLPVGDVALNVSSSKIDDVAVNASKITDVELADEDAGAASILDAKSPGVGIAGNEYVYDCEDLPLENFPPGGLDYGDALQDASSVEEVPSEDGDLLLSISSGPLTQEALLLSQDFLSTDPESAAILVSSQDVPSSNPEIVGIMVSSQELPSSSNPHSPESGNVVKVDMFLFIVTRLHTNRTKCHKPMFQNKQCDAGVGSIDKAFVPTGMLNLDSADVVLYSLCQKYRDTDKLIVPRRTKIRDGNIDSNVLNWFTRSGADGFDQIPIVELIDSDDDVFDKIAGVRRVTRSAAAKGLSPLAGIVARRAAGARKDPALDSGNVVSMKRAPRAPIKFYSPVQQFYPHKFPHPDKAPRNTFSMIPQPDESVTSFTGNCIWEVFSPGHMLEGDVIYFLIDDWKQDPERNADFASGKRVLLSPYIITVVLDCMFYGDENKVFNVESAVRDFKSYVKDKEDLLSANLPRIVDWNTEDLYRVVFNWNSQLVVTELPKEVQALAPDA